MSDYTKFNKGNVRKEVVGRNDNFLFFVIQEKLDCILAFWCSGLIKWNQTGQHCAKTSDVICFRRETLKLDVEDAQLFPLGQVWNSKCILIDISQQTNH